MLARFYEWFWFHTEWYLTPKDRRPYTFIMRDWIYTHVPLFCVLVFLFYAGMITLSVWHGTAATITTSLCSFLLAHLVWGTKWIEHEQEFPEYIPDGTASTATVIKINRDASEGKSLDLDDDN